MAETFVLKKKWEAKVGERAARQLADANEPGVDAASSGGKLAGSPAASEAVKGHAYWGWPEWQLVGASRLPSPLKQYVEARSAQPPSEGKLKKQQRAAVETAVRVANVDARVALAKDGLAQRAAAKSGRSSLTRAADAAPMLVDEDAGHALLVNQREVEAEIRLDVPRWDFVSPHALEQEYIETLSSSVSLI